MASVLLKFDRGAISALMALTICVAVIGCGGDNSSETAARETDNTTAPENAETSEIPKAPETPAPAAKAEKPMAKETESAPAKTEPEPTPKKTETPAPAPKTSKAPATSATNQKPEVAVKAWFEGLAKGPSSVWDAFPASYQKDVNGLVHLFSENMDADLWGRGFGTVNKLAALLKSKKEILLDPSFLQGANMEKEEAGAAFDHLVGILETLAASDISSLDKMKRFDGGKFLSTSGAQFFTHVEPLANLASAKQGKTSKLSDIANTKVTLVKSEGNTATLKIEVPNEEPREKDFIKVEGKWIPENLSPEKWKEKMDEARKNLAQLAPSLKEKKTSALQAFDMIDGFLGKVEKVETKEELQAELFAIMRPVMQVFQQLQKGAMQGKKPEAPAPEKTAPAKEAPAKESPAKPAEKKE